MVCNGEEPGDEPIRNYGVGGWVDRLGLVGMWNSSRHKGDAAGGWDRAVDSFGYFVGAGRTVYGV